MDKDMNYGSDYKYIPATSIGSGMTIQVLPDLFCHTVQIVNIILAGDPNTKDFILVDAGMPHSANEIISVVEEYYGANSHPKAIILTHGHFDHVGAIIELVKHWEIPVYAHELELPYLTGQKSYPEPDPTVEGGLIAKMSPLFPNEPINLDNHVEKLPADGTIPYLPDFCWIHTPGHSPGHISLFRESDNTLIVGDAFVTVKQDSLYKVITQKQEINGPPRYFTTDWEAAKESVIKLASLSPSVAITGHGLPMSGELLTKSLEKLVHDFDQIAVPDFGKYVDKNLH
ncbi:MBL fold metallo-hydrolase [Cytobacillus solani]|uniref:MBL fold metallo-hydrolase n=1 Tax=Cytobacillus solani TaxID=1637975 RepID=A0A0Q3VIJ8_9BACI|nr:MBL fold metallo-hydrolase [Cytobacillus solani]KOP83002.1 metallo-beta-lactamase [Bacillus sp. FJAT-21945]KQL20026.1 MBL fold metallo-hydrolase [Cytobacillus solani]USK53271.1 MBL fold metallo-hydrolase [Cytobacillus solani]